MKEGNYQDIDERTFNFAVRVIRMTYVLPNNPAVWKIVGQVIDSATSINSNIVQARAGVSRKDFINHFRIAFKEAVETKRWIEMIVALKFIPAERVVSLLNENKEIISIIVAIIKNSIAGK
jgi:four helix bundle protein